MDVPRGYGMSTPSAVGSQQNGSGPGTRYAHQQRSQVEPERDRMSGIARPWNRNSLSETPPPPRSDMQATIAEFRLRSDSDVKLAAQRARLLATLTDLPDRERTAFGQAVREVGLNAVQHAGSARVQFRIESDQRVALIETAVLDDQPVTPELETLINADQGPDCGLRRARSLATRLIVEPIREGGKVIRIRMEVPEHVAAITETDIAEWTSILRTRRTQAALASSQRRSRELAQQLASIQRQRQDLESELNESKSLNETLTLLSLVASKTDNAVIIMGEAGLITWINDAFIRMTGFTLPDSTGSRPDTLLAGPESDRQVLREIEQAFRLGHGVSEELLQYRRDGQTSWISLSLTPIHDESGHVSRWIGIGADITKRREAQNALEAARNAAETASRLKGEFLANMSHEIRTPMNAIIGMTDLALCTDLDDDQHDYLTTVKQSAESLLELLNDVLDLSKIESGRLDLEETPFHLLSLLRDTLKPLAFVAHQKGLRLDWSVPADVPEWLIGDPIRVQQVLVNLTGNAVKFTKEGSVEVSVETQWESGDEVGLLFSVADTGVGIPPDKLDHIFDSFTQADTSITRQFGGTGLGLAISSELLHLMNGRIWVQSEVGRGSRFHFSLRMRLAGRAEIPEPQSDRQREPETASLLSASQRPLEILVADDHPANRKLIARILEKPGHKISFAENGHEVLTAFDSQPFDMVLMDVQMPEMDGFQATAAIRDRELTAQSHVPIIAVTAHTMQGDRDACLAAGMDAYLSKPIRARELLTLVESLSDNQVNVSAQSATATGYVTTEGQSSSRPEPEADQTPPATHDFSGALERMDQDEELLREQMGFFLTDGPILLDALQTAAQEQDGPAMQIAAHRLKNLCATFDDDDTAALCDQLEFLARDETVDINKVALVQAAVARLIGSIKTFCSN